jgi:hypothetical protein
MTGPSKSSRQPKRKVRKIQDKGIEFLVLGFIFLILTLFLKTSPIYEKMAEGLTYMAWGLMGFGLVLIVVNRLLKPKNNSTDENNKHPHS